jgi:hypothetical protein
LHTRVGPSTPFPIGRRFLSDYPGCHQESCMAHRVTMFARRPASTSPSRRSANTNHDHVLIAAAETSMCEFVDSVVCAGAVVRRRRSRSPGSGRAVWPGRLAVTAEARETTWSPAASPDRAAESQSCCTEPAPVIRDPQTRFTSRGDEFFLDTSVTDGGLQKAVSIQLYGRLPTDKRFARDMTYVPLQI